VTSATGFLVADDLTGACDAAAVFARHGWTAGVWLKESPPAVDLLACSTHSRDDPPGEAAQKVTALCHAFNAPAIPLLFKKVDSVLRGNVEAEVAAMLAASTRGAGVMCTAFPEQGRVVKSGFVHAASALLPVPQIEGVESRDAATTAELDEIARHALSRHPWPLLIGSSGLAGSLARLLARPPISSAALVCRGTPVLCIGSSHPVTVRQIDWLRSQPRQDYLLVPVEMYCPDFPLTGGLFLCGGDTALMVCRKLDVHWIELAGEIQRGIPIGRIHGGVADGCTVVTKSGGFGADDVLGHVIDVLSGGEWCESP
jgi:uncharacterized protein YgbK (DUF1537 family)